MWLRAPVSYAYVDRQYKRHYAAQKRITRQAKVKQTSGPQTVKTQIKSFFAFSHFIHVFAPPFRSFNFAFYTLSVFALAHFHILHFIRALWVMARVKVRVSVRVQVWSGSESGSGSVSGLGLGLGVGSGSRSKSGSGLELTLTLGTFII